MDAESGGFTYDANGNMLTAPAPYGVTAAFYDHQNLPLLLTANGVMSAYRYDEQGQRISKRVTGSNLDEFYILDGRTSLGVVTVDGAGNTVSWSWNVLAGDKVVGRETQTAQRFHYHTDLLGTTRVVVQGTTIVEAYDYDPWGVRLEGRILAGPTKEGFTTKERDGETGLDYFGARYYMAALGRWTSVDPLVGSFPAWSGFNYVENDPARQVDPFGLCVPVNVCLAAAVGIIGGVAQLASNVINDRPFSEGVGSAAAKGAAFGLTLGLAAPALFAGSGGETALTVPGLGLQAGASSASVPVQTGAVTVTSFASKTSAREALAGMGLSSVQSAAALRAVARATSTTTIEFIQREGGDLLVNLMRPGRNGFQSILSSIGPNGLRAVTQVGVDRVGRVIVDPKFP